MSTHSENQPAALLSTEQLEAIRTQLAVTRCRNEYVTDYGVAADVLADVMDHLSAREAQLKQVLQAALLPMSGYESSRDGYIELSYARCVNRAIYAVATAIGIPLETAQ